MKTEQITPSEMEKYVARFKSMKPQSDMYEENMGLPKEAYNMMSAQTLYLLMAPDRQGGPHSAGPAVTCDEKMSVIIAECPPGDSPMLHAHHRTRETFLCLDGKFAIRFGDKGEHETIIEPYDMIAVPTGVVRQFVNVTDKPARLLVIIAGDAEDDFNDIEFTPEEAERLRAAFGAEVVDRFREIGWSFEAGLNSDGSAAD